MPHSAALYRVGARPSIRTLRALKAARRSAADQAQDEIRPAALKAARRSAAEHVPHQEPEIERARVDEQPLEDVGMPAQVNSAQPAGVIESVGATFAI